MTQAYVFDNYVEPFYVGVDPFLTPPEYHKNARWWARCWSVSPDYTPVFCVTNTSDYYSYIKPWSPAYSTEYYADGWDDTEVDVLIHNRLDQVTLRDTTSGWVNKFNALVGVLDNFNYLQTSDDVGYDPTRKPWKLALEPITVETRFGAMQYDADNVLQYVGNDRWEDLGIIDTDPIELFRVGRFQRKSEYDADNLRAIAPVIEEWYQGLTDVEVYEF